MQESQKTVLKKIVKCLSSSIVGLLSKMISILFRQARINPVIHTFIPDIILELPTTHEAIKRKLLFLLKEPKNGEKEYLDR